MEVTLKATTCPKKPLSYIGSIAGMCYDRQDKGDPVKRAINIGKQGHLSPFEHLVFTWDVQGLSRAISHQLVRHRIASYTQQSQRYVKVEEFDIDDYVIPPAIAKDDVARKKFELSCKASFNTYAELIEDGFKPEDARYLLPNAKDTRIVVTMNCREFAHFYALRSDKAAQWEIRIMAEKMLETLNMDDEYQTLYNLIKEGAING